jgi:hypothetical protein
MGVVDTFEHGRHWTEKEIKVNNGHALFFHNSSNILAIVMLVVYCLGPGWVVDCKSSKEKVMDAGRNLHLQKKNCYDRHRAMK